MCASHENEVANYSIENENIGISTLSQKPEEESDNLEGPITIQEAMSALRQIENDKSPGSDGYKKIQLSFSNSF